MAGNREPLEKLLREEIGGNLSALLDRIKNRPDLSLIELAERAAKGKMPWSRTLVFPRQERKN
jgi:hypothetical protein